MARIVTGIQPSGRLHLGNYFGAIQPIINLQDQNECVVFIADLHALTSTQGPKIVDLTTEMAFDLIALGLDPVKVQLFRQSSVSQVTEAAWYLSHLITKGQLERGHSYKDKTAKDEPVYMGLFTYPLLMAADILLHGADLVPVGRDQLQHVEVTRDLAVKFNTRFGQTFVLPVPASVTLTEMVPGTDGTKMSKSKGNIIGIFDTEEQIGKAVHSIKTDNAPKGSPKDPDSNIVYQLLKLVDKERTQVAKAGLEDGSLGYVLLKQMLFEGIMDRFGDARKRRAKLTKEEVQNALYSGAVRADQRARMILYDMRFKMGTSL